MDLTTILFVLSLPFVLLTVYFGTKMIFTKVKIIKVMDVLMMLEGNYINFAAKYTSPLTIKLPYWFIYFICYLFAAFLQLSKFSIGIECNDGLVIPLTSGLPPGPCL